MSVKLHLMNSYLFTYAEGTCVVSLRSVCRLSCMLDEYFNAEVSGW